MGVGGLGVGGEDELNESNASGSDDLEYSQRSDSSRRSENEEQNAALVRQRNLVQYLRVS